ncbi:hypothetical protein [Streptomyces sp. NPDC052727]|uniref:hypothetical protein n=1 Tax=unclassified Streptomyces TaxID=2593676 RepID=UPI00341B350B
MTMIRRPSSAVRPLSLRWASCWKTALNAFGITFDGRLSAARQQPSASLVAPFD